MNSTSKVILGVVALAAAGAVGYYVYKQSQSLSSCTYPVTVNSPPGCIMKAFQLSGYWSLLDPSQQAAAQSDPAGWLSIHPYLYDTYPQYFAQA